MHEVRHRMKWLLWSGILLCHIAPVVQAGTAENKVAAEEAMRRANNYFQANYSIGISGWERSTYQTGNFRAWETLGVQAYYDRAVAWGEANSWYHGTDYGDWDGNSTDAHCCGQTYIDLYNVDPQSVRTNNITELLDGLLLNNRPDSVDDWWWIDAFYMAGSTLARLGVLNSDAAYLDQMYDMYDYMKYSQGGGLFNASEGLWWRDPNYKSSAPDTYWGRGNGWVIGSCVRILEQLPADDTTYRPEFESMLQTMAAALLPWQQSDGFWRSDITHPVNQPNPETSGTAFFTYAIAYGLNEGLLIDSPGTNYTAAVSNAWKGLSTIALHPNGKLGYTQAVGSNPQPANYESERDYGCGAFLLAGGEILCMLGGPAPVYANAGTDLLLTDANGDSIETASLTVTNSLLRSGTIEGYSWWSGPVYLGAGSELNVDFPLGTNTVTLQIEHSDGNRYTDDLRVVVLPPHIQVSASGNQAGNPPENTLDGDLNTRWSQDGNDGSQWIQFELPSSYTFNHIDLAAFNGDSRSSRFSIWLSPDGSESNLVRVLPSAGNWWTDYISSSGTTLDLETYSFPAQPVTLVRVQGWGNSSSSWNSYTDVNIPIPVIAIDDQADADANELPDSWEIYYLGTTGQVASAEIGATGITLGEAYVLGLDPVTPDATPLLQINVVSNQPALSLNPIGAFGVGYQGLSRKYTVQAKESLTNETWVPLPGYNDYVSDNLLLEVGITNAVASGFYRVTVGVAPDTDEAALPRTYGRFVPERSDDFAWENDKAAFRAYGPDLRSGAENGGFDCWLKRVSYPIIDKWYKLDSYHTDHGEGYDPYHVGESLGCGSIGLWASNSLITTETFVSAKIVQSELQETIFELNYLWSYGGHDYKLKKRISITMGDRLFNCVATFWQDGVLATELPVAIGLTTHDGSATADHDLAGGWMSCWETIDELGLGTGVIMDPGSIVDYQDIASATADQSHALLIANTDENGQVSWWSGYGWEGAGEITNSVQWNSYLSGFDIGH